MAKRTIVTLEDDIDGGTAVETVTFAIDATVYEIDLNEKNAAALRDALAPYVGAARRLGRSTRGSAAPRARGGNTGSGVDLSVIREWARANGHQVSDRGRVSAAIQDAYDAAH